MEFTKEFRNQQNIKRYFNKFQLDNENLQNDPRGKPIPVINMNQLRKRVEGGKEILHDLVLISQKRHICFTYDCFSSSESH